MHTTSRERRAARIEAEALRHLARLDPAAVAAVAIPAAPPSAPEVEPVHGLIEQARVEAAALGLPLALAQAAREYRFLLALGALAAILTGTGLVTAAGLVSASGQLNVYAVLLMLVGLNGLGLLVWLGSLLFRPRLAAGTLARAGAVGPLAERWLRRLGCDAVGLAARLACLDARVGPTLQPWAGASLVHAFWLVALLGAVLMLGLRLMVEQVDFVWETTLLARAHFEWLTATLGWLPGHAGLPVPDGEQIALTAGGLGVPADHPAAIAARKAWAGWLIGSTLAYGALPRLLALGICLLLQQQRERQRGLPLAHPFWLHRLHRLEQAAVALGSPSALPGARPFEDPLAVTAPPPRGGFTGTPGWVLGLELDAAAGWPPALPTGWSLVTNATAAGPPVVALPEGAAVAGRLVILASLARAPDRGLVGWLSETGRAWPGPVELALTDGERALRRLGDRAALEQRASDWASAARAAGLSRCWWLAGRGSALEDQGRLRE